MVVVQEFVDLETPTGVMRTHILRPAAEDRYPGVLFYSEIFQVTEPVRRLAAVWRLTCLPVPMIQTEPSAPTAISRAVPGTLCQAPLTMWKMALLELPTHG